MDESPPSTLDEVRRTTKDVMKRARHVWIDHGAASLMAAELVRAAALVLAPRLGSRPPAPAMAAGCRGIRACGLG